MTMAARNCVIAGAVVVAAIAGLDGPRSTQQSDAHKNWRSGATAPPEVPISACTALIESGKESNDELAIAFGNRATAYAMKGQIDNAFRDFDQAIKLNP